MLPTLRGCFAIFDRASRPGHGRLASRAKRSSTPLWVGCYPCSNSLILERRSPTKDQRLVDKARRQAANTKARIGLDCLGLSWRAAASKAPLKSLPIRCEVRVPKEARRQGTGRQVAAANQEAIGHRACKTAARRKAEPTCHEELGKAAKTSSHFKPDPGSGALRRLHVSPQMEGGRARRRRR